MKKSEGDESLVVYRQLMSAATEVLSQDDFTSSTWKIYCQELARNLVRLDMALSLGGTIPEHWVTGEQIPEDK